MKSIQLLKYGGYDELTIINSPVPKAGAGQVLVRNSVIAVNPYDCMARQGKMWFLEGFSFPKILGCETAGIVEQVGAGVSSFHPGDRVVTCLGRRGGYAEYISVSEKNVVALPDEVSFEAAASLPIAGTSAYDIVHKLAPVKRGDEVLVLGAGGSLGSFAVQIARLAGAEVTAVCSERKMNSVKELGIAAVVNYTDLKSLNKKWHVILDCTSRLRFEEGKKLMGHSGIMIGVLPGPAAMFQQFITSRSNKKFKVLFGAPTAEKIKVLVAWVKAGQLKPLLGNEFPFDQMNEAHRLCESGVAIGKILVRVHPEN